MTSQRHHGLVMTSHANFHDNTITAKGDNDITKSSGTTILQTSSTPHTLCRTYIQLM